jgi:hypothetical protein
MQLPGLVEARLPVFTGAPISFAIWAGKRAFGSFRSFAPDSDHPLTGLLPRNAPIGISRP